MRNLLEKSDHLSFFLGTYNTFLLKDKQRKQLSLCLASVFAPVNLFVQAQHAATCDCE